MCIRDRAKQGAQIIFYGDLPNKQPSYADGNYAALDQQVVDAATAITTNYDNVACVSTMEEYTDVYKRQLPQRTFITIPTITGQRMEPMWHFKQRLQPWGLIHLP